MSRLEMSRSAPRIASTLSKAERIRSVIAR
jgi:hypothetical protein